MQHDRTVRRPLSRFREVLHRHGFRGVFSRIMVRVGRGPVSVWRRLFQYRNHVFVCEGGIEALEPAGLTVLNCRRHEDLPEPVLDELVRFHENADALDVDRWELRHGAVQWFGLIEGRLACTSMSRKGRYFTRWFVPLRDDDVVIFRNATVPAFRGRGFCPALMRRIITEELSNDDKAYVDCRVYNHASIRSIEKAGFRRIATLRPLRPGTAVRDRETASRPESVPDE